MHYCAYQERSHKEARDKLYGYGLYPSQVENILAQLIEEEYLNEERFAIAFAGGKFRINQWGKIKIGSTLKQKGISDYCIKKALNSIDQLSYQATLNKLYNNKLKEISRDDNVLVKKRKVYSYLIQKGYENELVNSLLEKM